MPWRGAEALLCPLEAICREKLRSQTWQSQEECLVLLQLTKSHMHVDWKSVVHCSDLALRNLNRWFSASTTSSFMVYLALGLRPDMATENPGNILLNKKKLCSEQRCSRGDFQQTFFKPNPTTYILV